MKYHIIWSDFAEKQIENIFNYYENRVNVQLARKIINEIISAPNKLIENPEIGVKEPLLAAKKLEFKYIIYSNYKIIYTIDKLAFKIKIYDVFDTRQNPVKIKRVK